MDSVKTLQPIENTKGVLAVLTVLIKNVLNNKKIYHLIYVSTKKS